MQRPNILVFMTDQQRADSLYRAYMPHVEQLQREGVTFTNSYTVAPHCCPSRATFFSGLYPSQHGVWNNVKFGNALSRGFYEGVRLFSEDLKDAGYRMRFSGKWHASVMEGPLDRGFDMMDEPVPRPGTRCKYVIGDLKKKRTATPGRTHGSGGCTTTTARWRIRPGARRRSAGKATRRSSSTESRKILSRTRTWWGTRFEVF